MIGSTDPLRFPMNLSDVIKNAPQRPDVPLRPEVLLSSNTVKPMHGVVPRIILGREWWDATRFAAYEYTNFRCIACGVHKYDALEHKWLEGHEVYKTDYEKGRMTYVETVALCHYCHCYIHDGRLKSLMEQKQITEQKYKAVLKHGDAILNKAKLSRPKRKGKCAPWSKWRLILNGEEYPPVYKDYQHWLRAFWEQDDGCPTDPGS